MHSLPKLNTPCMTSQNSCQPAGGYRATISKLHIRDWCANYYIKYICYFSQAFEKFLGRPGLLWHLSSQLRNWGLKFKNKNERNRNFTNENSGLGKECATRNECFHLSWESYVISGILFSKEEKHYFRLASHIVLVKNVSWSVSCLSNETVFFSFWFFSSTFSPVSHLF